MGRGKWQLTINSMVVINAMKKKKIDGIKTTRVEWVEGPKEASLRRRCLSRDRKEAKKCKQVARPTGGYLRWVPGCHT